MNDYSDLIGQHLSGVAAQTISGLDENPDDAARSVQLEGATGTPAPIINDDLEEFEKNHRAMLASNIVVNNPELRKYVQSHPMAAAVSNDDWGNLDQFSQGASTTQRVLRALHTPLDSMMDAAIQGGKEGFTEGYGEYSPEVQRALDPRQNILGPVGALAATALYGTGSLLSGAFGATVGAARGAATAVGGEAFGRDIGSMTEYEMMKGEGHPTEAPPIPTEGMRARLEFDQASTDFAQAQTQAKNNSVMYWAQNGKEPPRGISPEVDQAKAQLNAQVLDKLDEDLSNAQASLTRERSPEMFRKFVEQHYGDTTIGINGDAVVALYGDKLPAPDDGLLGQVPGLAEQLDAARATGADVHVPVADWVMVDPAVAKALHDDVRVWPGGITAREAAEPIEPKAIVDSPLAQERGAFGLEPMFAMGDRKLQLLRTQEGKPFEEIFTGGWESVPGGTVQDIMDHYQILDEKGQPVGQMRIGRGDDKELLVDWIGGQAGLWSNSFGPSLIRDLKRQLKALYPDYEWLTGHRISGARDAAGAPDELRVPRVRLATDPSMEDFRQSRQILDSAWKEVGESGIFGAYEPTSAYTANELAMGRAVREELRRIVGKEPAIHAVSGVVYPGVIDRRIEAAFIAHTDRAPTILFDLLGKDPLGYGRHEAMHYLRRYGFFEPEEWNTLEQAALGEDWLQRYDIAGRYPDLDVHGQLEEAIAEGFREWAAAGRPDSGGVAGIFQKLWDFLQSLKQRFTELFGHEPTWEELFQKVDRGEVAGRGPGKPMQEGAFDLRPALAVDDMDNLRANSLGIDKKTFSNLREALEKRYEEDLEAAQKRAEREQKRRQTAEWKTNRAELSKDVESTIRQRPDVAADLFIGSGELYGEKLRQRYTLRAEDLSPEQVTSLPNHYVSKNGLPVDEVARLFGYGSGDAMVERLAVYQKIKGDLSPQKALEKLIDAETDRQMEAKYGNLGTNIADEARDQALSETNLNLALQEYQAEAMKSGAKVIDKDLAKQAAENILAKLPHKDVSSDAFMRDVARHASNAAKSQINGDPASTVQSLQAKTLSLFMAAEARKIEKLRSQFERTAKQMSNRVVPGMDPEYTNYVHNILGRIGMKVKRTAEDLAKEIDASSAETLEKFVQQKSLALRELPVWDQLYDPKWQKPYDQLTVDEFKAIAQTVKSLVHNGKDEMKVEVAGNKVDLADLKAQLIEKLEKFPRIDYTQPGGARRGPGLLRTKIADHLQLENIFNRWDEYDPHGVWNQFGIRGLIEGSNQADAWKKEFAQRIRESDDGIDMYKSIDNTIFRQPIRDGFGDLIQFNRGNLRAVMLNTGNASNLTKLAKGYGLTGDQVMAWVHSKATKEDWDWVQKIWDMFKDLKGRSDTMYRNLTGGVPAQDVRVSPIQTKFGEYRGGYYPVIWHDIFKGKSKALIGKDVLEENNYVRATTPAGYTKTRTGYTAPMALSIDELPNRIAQEIHDIALRPAVIQASKIFYDSDIQQAITNHYGKEYADLLVPYLRDVANVQNFMSKSQAEFNTISGFFRQNLITTLVGFNPGTVMKHAPTALGLSIKEVGPQRFLDAVKSLYSINEYTGESNWQFAMKNSLELQRRERNWRETLYGAAGDLGQTSKLTVPTSLGQAKQQFASLRATIMELSSWPVAMSDKASAVPTWLAQYRKSMEEGATHGDAIYDADRAVRRAHGSTATTNKPQIMRDSNPWFTSVYNFYSDVMNRQMETLWKAGKTMDLIKDGDWKEAKQYAGMVAGGMMAYVIWPAMVEQWVSPVNEDPKASWAKKSAIGLAQSLSSSWIGVRDIVNGMLSGRDPSAGLISTAYKEVTDFARDWGKQQPLSNEHAGKVIKDGMSLAGLLTGMVPGQIGREAQLAHDVHAGVEHPRGPWQWLVGLRFGTTKGHSKSWDNYLKGNYK